MRVGYGIRHPDLLRLLRSETSAAVEEVTWGNGTVPLRVSAYTRPRSLPDELVTSIRCLVVVGGQILVCRNADGHTHAWPGGRRERGETYEDTAVREVHEETGWLLDRQTIRYLGWIHLEHLTTQPESHPYPHPDFLQIVLRAEASAHAGDPNEPWMDVEGYELGSSLHSIADARDSIVGDELCRLFLPSAVWFGPGTWVTERSSDIRDTGRGTDQGGSDSGEKA